MIAFALAMHSKLELLNADAFQSFQLRIGKLSCRSQNTSNNMTSGLSLGPLVAGVIGAQKPQYDIWGNTVNLASRMDSHGAIGHIHVCGSSKNWLFIRFCLDDRRYGKSAAQKHVCVDKSRQDKGQRCTRRDGDLPSHSWRPQVSHRRSKRRCPSSTSDDCLMTSCSVV